ncbi:F-box domain-containing protein [Rhynchospora pubera]|uniref:F-box domain-containing protein n=1 Tax=Rhynchospora pubera TaxID=906938 RepID=A0AAV8DYP4_9POAL|nr:F-box domain-containing protein [Rhynchospora pubera]
MALRRSLPCSNNATLPGTDRAAEPDRSDLPPELICANSNRSITMAQRQSLPCSKKVTLPDTDGAEEPDWSDLPLELVCLISQKIADISDFVRFGVVCKRWQCAVRASDLSPQLPWIMHEYDKYKEGNCRRFYSLLTRKTCTVNIPHSGDTSLVGSTNNYLLTRNWQTHECSLFNPLTKEELSLPPTPPEITFPSWVPTGPSFDPSSMYVVISRSRNLYSTPLYVCRPGDHEWIKIRDPYTPLIEGKFKNSGYTFYDGKCYASDLKTRSTKVIDLATSTVLHVVPRPEPSSTGFYVYLVVSFGRILRVCLYGKYSSKKNCLFRIYQLETGNRDGNQKEPCWTEIDSINNQFLFLHDRHGSAFRAEDFPGFEGNSIYFSKSNFMGKTFQLFSYDIKEKKIEELPGPVNLSHHWFLPSLC